MNREQAHAEVDRYFDHKGDGAAAVFVVEVDDFHLREIYGMHRVDKWKADGRLQEVVDTVCGMMDAVFHQMQFDECLETATTDLDLPK